jgi:hypothetical protein
MTRHRYPELVREAIVMLTGAGLVGDVDLDGRHYKVHWRVNGHKRSLIISKTPSGPHALVNSRTTLKRLLRQDGRL